MRDVALDYLRTGHCVLPAIAAEKRPALAGWKQYQRRLPTERQVETWFGDAEALCVLTGVVSGNLELVDFDHQAELYDAWRKLVIEQAPGLVQRLVIETSQSGGKHVAYRCETPIDGSLKLAQRTVVAPSADPIEVAGKTYIPRRVGDRFEVLCTLIETRGEGGLFLCDPTPGYALEQGAFTELPVLTAAERAVLIEAASALTETMPLLQRLPALPIGAGRPGDDFNERGDVREVLVRHGWTLVRGGENEHWRRPGKEVGWSATLREGVFYVFSTSAAPFDARQAYPPFAVYAHLEHGGDFSAAAAALRAEGYLLALAYSSVGKDWPRKVNTHILHRVGLVDALGEKFASGEGIQDALFLTPAMLFQTDEIDGLLQSINKARDARHENIMGTLLTMYSSANSIYPMRRKAGKESPGVIDQPCLVVYGTAIPTHYYEALSERMLTNGFFARMLIVESGPRSPGQEPGIIDPPESVMNVARWWADFNPGAGNLQNWHPEPHIVPASAEAIGLLAESRRTAEAEYASAQERDDPVGTTVWGRVPEQVRKLALLYAVSASHEEPEIDVDAVRWASAFMLHQTRRMLFMAAGHVADNPFHAECLKLVRKLQQAPGRQLTHSVLLKRMKIDAKTFTELVTTLEQQGDIVTTCRSTAGRPHRAYQLVGESVGEK